MNGLDPTRLQTFVNQFLEAFNKNAKLRAIYAAAGALEISDSRDGMDPLVCTMQTSRTALTPGPILHRANPVMNGRKMGYIEDRAIIGELLKVATTRTVSLRQFEQEFTPEKIYVSTRNQLLDSGLYHLVTQGRTECHVIDPFGPKDAPALLEGVLVLHRSNMGTLRVVPNIRNGQKEEVFFSVHDRPPKTGWLDQNVDITIEDYLELEIEGATIEILKIEAESMDANSHTAT